MASFGSVVWSSIGKKVITGLTGLALVAFVVVHLIGNLTLLLGPGPFNEYAHFLETMAHGQLIYVAEMGMIVLFLAHMITAVSVAWLDRRKARRVGYRYSTNAGGKSRKTLSSTTMIYTGSLLLVFIIWHIKKFKFGGAVADADGVKNLYKVVVSGFQDPVFTTIAVVMMIILGFHLRHGVWSAFQSLGLANDRYLPTLERIGFVLAILLALGFIAIPLVLFFAGDPNAVVGGH